MISNRPRVIPGKCTLLVFVALLLWPVCGVAADRTHPEEFGIRERPARRETVLDLVFGSAPRMATERGILVIDAFEDLDDDKKWDQDEPELRNQIVCKVDRINYTIPAFIPGLDYNNRYEVRCSGEHYYPTMPDKEILIEHRGHVIQIELPCRKNSPEESTDPR